jgi:hypothetical protein
MSKPHHSRYMTCNFALILIMLNGKPFRNLSTGEFLCNHPTGDFVGVIASVWLCNIDGLTMVYWTSCPGQFLTKIFGFILNNLYPIRYINFSTHVSDVSHNSGRFVGSIIDRSRLLSIIMDQYWLQLMVTFFAGLLREYYDSNLVTFSAIP